jgi:GTP-sensing pleiotropic transcriptional regulator CodY
MTTQMQKSLASYNPSYIGIEEQPNWKKSCRKITRIVGTEQHLGAFILVRRRKHSQ